MTLDSFVIIYQGRVAFCSSYFKRNGLPIAVPVETFITKSGFVLPTTGYVGAMLLLDNLPEVYHDSGTITDVGGDAAGVLIHASGAIFERVLAGDRRAYITTALPYVESVPYIRGSSMACEEAVEAAMDAMDNDIEKAIELLTKNFAYNPRMNIVIKDLAELIALIQPDT